MRYFFDTEFAETTDGLKLISIGVVADDGREFYAVASEWNYIEHVSDWVRENVLTRLQPTRWPGIPPMAPAAIAAGLQAWIGDDKAPEFWAYYGAHDWVALCNLMGGMLKLPEGWPWLYLELRVKLNEHGLADFKDDGRADEHNALADARWVRFAYGKCSDRALSPSAREGEAG